MIDPSERSPCPASGEAVSRLFTEDGQQFLRVTATHAICTDWLAEHSPQLYQRWLSATDDAVRDRLAAHIESRFTALEPDDRNPPPRRVPPVRAGRSARSVVHR